MGSGAGGSNTSLVAASVESGARAPAPGGGQGGHAPRRRRLAAVRLWLDVCWPARRDPPAPAPCPGSTHGRVSGAGSSSAGAGAPRGGSSGDAGGQTSSGPPSTAPSGGAAGGGGAAAARGPGAPAGLPPPAPQQPGLKRSMSETHSGSSHAVYDARGGGSLDSARSPHSARSSFVLENLGGRASEAGGGGGGPVPPPPDVDAYGRPSFAAFEPQRESLLARAGGPPAAPRPGALPAASVSRGSVFESALPPDLAWRYRALGALLPQAPLPLATLTRVWRYRDAADAAEAAHIFEMQVGPQALRAAPLARGSCLRRALAPLLRCVRSRRPTPLLPTPHPSQGVVKTATLKDGSVWVMASPEHIAYIGSAHVATMPKLHAGILAAFEGGEGGGPPLHPLDFQVGARGRATGGSARLQQARALLTQPRRGLLPAAVPPGAHRARPPAPLHPVGAERRLRDAGPGAPPCGRGAPGTAQGPAHEPRMAGGQAAPLRRVARRRRLPQVGPAAAACGPRAGRSAQGSGQHQRTLALLSTDRAEASATMLFASSRPGSSAPPTHPQVPAGRGPGPAGEAGAAGVPDERARVHVALAAADDAAPAGAAHDGRRRDGQRGAQGRPLREGRAAGRAAPRPPCRAHLHGGSLPCLLDNPSRLATSALPPHPHRPVLLPPGLVSAGVCRVRGGPAVGARRRRGRRAAARRAPPAVTHRDAAAGRRREPHGAAWPHRAGARGRHLARRPRRADRVG
jgi:hypothetical protein